MDKVNALTLRQSLGKVLRNLQRGGVPVLVEKDRKPAAVLISIEDYKRRFVDRDADEARLAIVSRIAEAKLTLPKDENAISAVQRLRNGLP